MDLYEHYRLVSIEKRLDKLRQATSQPNPFAPKQADIETLQQEIGELRLLVAVLYRVILDKGLAAEPEIHHLLSTLDSVDGRRDGAFQGDAVAGVPRVEPPEPENPFPKIRT
jgi:hypothetical protein